MPYFGSIARSSVIAENLPLWSMRTVRLSFFVTLISIQLPRSGMTRQLRQPALARFHFGNEVDTRAAVQLADHDALGAVDDELAAAEHDRHVAEVDLFLDRLLFVQPQPDAERPAVGQPQLAAFVRLVARLAQLVAQVLELELSCRSSRSGRFPQDAFQPFVLALVGRASSYCRNRA